MTQIAIIGAGISGLTCAATLEKKGLKTVVFEKSRSLGGRCATRKWNNHIVDHGAQYFTAKTSEFLQSLETLLDVSHQDLLPIQAPFVDFQDQEVPSESERFYHLKGNNFLGRTLAQKTEVRLEHLISNIKSNGEAWTINKETFDAVVCCAPYPQTEVIFNLTPSRQDIPSNLYSPCLTAFFEYTEEWIGLSQERYALIDPTYKNALSWSACENHKQNRIQPGYTVFVVQASPSFSRRYLEAQPEEYLPLLQKELEKRWQLPSNKRGRVFAHRWRYAKSSKSLNFENLNLPPQLFICGDTRVKSSVESVWMNGVEVAQKVLNSFSLV